MDQLGAWFENSRSRPCGCGRSMYCGRHLRANKLLWYYTDASWRRRSSIYSSGRGWVGRWVGGGPSEEGLRQRLRTPARGITRPLQATLWTMYCPQIAFRPLRPLGGPRRRRGLQAFAFGHISCKCVLNVDPYVWRFCHMWPQYRWRRRTLRALRTKRSHLDTAVSVRASRNRRASHSSSRYT